MAVTRSKAVTRRSRGFSGRGAVTPDAHGLPSKRGGGPCPAPCPQGWAPGQGEGTSVGCRVARVRLNGGAALCRREANVRPALLPVVFLLCFYGVLWPLKSCKREQSLLGAAEGGHACAAAAVLGPQRRESGAAPPPLLLSRLRSQRASHPTRGQQRSWPAGSRASGGRPGRVRGALGAARVFCHGAVLCRRHGCPLCWCEAAALL